VQSFSQIITTNKPTSSFFYRPDALPVAQPTVSKHLRENITFHGLAYPSSPGSLPTLSLTTNSSWLPWGKVAMPLISHLALISHLTLAILLWDLWRSRANLEWHRENQPATENCK